MTAVHDELMRNNRAVNWMPDNIKEGRMGNFLDNVIDWGLSPRALLGHAAAGLDLRMRPCARHRQPSRSC